MISVKNILYGQFNDDTSINRCIIFLSYDESYNREVNDIVTEIVCDKETDAVTITGIDIFEDDIDIEEIEDLLLKLSMYDFDILVETQKDYNSLIIEEKYNNILNIINYISNNDEFVKLKDKIKKKVPVGKKVKEEEIELDDDIEVEDESIGSDITDE